MFNKVLLASLCICLGLVAADSFAQATSTIQIDASTDYDVPVSAVHSAIAIHCVNAIGAASTGGGVNIGTQDPICQHLTMAEVSLEAYTRQTVWCADERPECDPVLMQEYLAQYQGHLDDANRITDQTSLAGQVGVTTLDAAPFLGLLWLLFFL